MNTSSADQRRERWIKTVYLERDSPFWALLFTGFFVLGLLALIDRNNRIAELEDRIRDLTPPQPVLVGQNQVMGTRTVPALTTGGAADVCYAPSRHRPAAYLLGRLRMDAARSSGL